MGTETDTLPEGWARATLGELATSPGDIAYGVLKPGPWTDGGVPMLRVKDVREGVVDDSDVYRIGEGLHREFRRTELRGGELLLSIQGTVGRVAVVPNRLRGANVSRTLAVVPLRDRQLTSWTWAALQSPQLQDSIRGETGGSTRDSLNLRDLREIVLPVAPSSEQHRIVAKVEELLAEVNQVRERLARVPAILKRFRQSVLSAACSGKLTEDWRGDHTDVEPAKALREKIRTARMNAADSDRARAKVEKSYANCAPCDGGWPDDLPEPWHQCQVNDAGEVCNGSTPTRKRKDYWNGHIPWVSSGEVQNCLIADTRETITKAGFDNSSIRLLPPDTVLIAMIGEGRTRGQSAILKLSAAINQNMAAVVLDHGLMSSEYLWYWFRYQYERNREVGGGSGPQALNCQRVRELPLALPPLAEQREIVRRVHRIESGIKANALGKSFDSMSGSCAKGKHG